MAYHYLAYGLSVECCFRLPELVSARSAPADLIIRLEEPLQSGENLELTKQFQCGNGTASFYWESVGHFTVSGGREIVVRPALGASPELLRLPLLGSVLAMALHQRGLLVLHASAVSIGGEGVAFIGWKGRGKSTTAAALFGRGHELLSDDVVALKVCDQGPPIIYPGYPQFKLWPDSIRASFGLEAESFPKLDEQCEKRLRRVNSGYASGAVPLKRIFVLESGTEVKIASLSPRDVLQQLLAHSYCSRYGRQGMSPALASRHFSHCMATANRTKVMKLAVPRALEELSRVAECVEQNLKGVQASQNDAAMAGAPC